MKTGDRSNALLVELLIVVAFFMLSATVLLQMFAAARNQSVQAGLLSGALNEAQNVADRLYAAPDAEAELALLGFTRQEDAWVRDEGDYQLAVSGGREEAPNGVMTRHEVRALQEGKELLSLPVARFREDKP